MSNTHIQLSDHFTYPRLLRFVAPSITMMIFTSIYGVVDGFFVSNYVGKTPFAALNFIMPFIMILGGMGPVDAMHSAAGKGFAGIYALFSGLVLVSVAGLLMAPFMHRLLHRFHLEGRREGQD